MTPANRQRLAEVEEQLAAIPHDGLPFATFDRRDLEWAVGLLKEQADAIRVAEWVILSCYDEDDGECNNCSGLRFQHRDDCPLLADEMYQLAESVLARAREAGIGDGE